MKLKVTGRNFDVGDALRSHIDQRLQQFRQKFFDHTIHAHVTLTKQRNHFHTDCTLHLATGLVLMSNGEASDATASFDAAAQHLEKQLRRYKQRLKSHQRKADEPLQQLPAASYVIQPQSDEDTVGVTEDQDLNPVIIAESVTSVPTLSVGEAVLALEISDTAFVLFKNAKSGTVNIVFRRPDGNIGWLDPVASQQL